MGLPTDYQQYIHTSRYARWSQDKGRRETWEETVARYEKFFGDRIPDDLLQELSEACDAVENLECPACAVL